MASLYRTYGPDTTDEPVSLLCDRFSPSQSAQSSRFPPPLGGLRAKHAAWRVGRRAVFRAVEKFARQRVWIFAGAFEPSAFDHGRSTQRLFSWKDRTVGATFQTSACSPRKADDLSGRSIQTGAFLNRSRPPRQFSTYVLRGRFVAASFVPRLPQNAKAPAGRIDFLPNGGWFCPWRYAPDKS